MRVAAAAVAAGVGKTLTHQLFAKGMYHKHPEAALDCPGNDCRGYKVLYGMDYLHSEREQQLEYTRNAVVEHIKVVIIARMTFTVYAIQKFLIRISRCP